MIEAIAVILLSVASPEDRLVESLRTCREIRNDRDRLECFDEAFILADDVVDGEGIDGDVIDDEGIDGEGIDAKGSSETESPSGSRTVEAETLPVGDSTPAVAVVPADGGNRQLVVSCDDGDLNVTIDWGQYLGSDAPAVTVRIDSLPPSNSKWARSEDKHASLLRPLGGKKVRQQKIASFVREVMAGQRLAARVIPRGQTIVTAEFDLSGAKAALKTVRRACVGR